MFGQGFFGVFAAFSDEFLDVGAGFGVHRWLSAGLVFRAAGCEGGWLSGFSRGPAVIAQGLVEHGIARCASGVRLHLLGSYCELYLSCCRAAAASRWARHNDAGLLLAFTVTAVVPHR